MLGGESCEFFKEHAHEHELLFFWWWAILDHSNAGRQVRTGIFVKC